METAKQKRPYVRGGQPCSEEGCGRRARARGLCPAHYARASRGQGSGALRERLGPTCSFDGCGRPHNSRGLCAGHAFQRDNGRPLTVIQQRQSPGGTCSARDCEATAANRGLCATHYNRQRKGDPDWERPIRSKAPNGTGHTDSHGYRLIYVDGKVRREHQVVMEGILGRPLESHESVHHRNGARADNRPENLEVWSTAQPAGQRPEDKVAFAVEMLRLYAPHLLA